jgi:hypothetical protein
MNPNTQQYLFLSAFYPQEKWHLLLQSIRQILSRPENQSQLCDAFIFLNHHRGDSVRLAIKKNSSADVLIFDHISDSINQFLIGSPSKHTPIKIPVTSFFCDFENNEIRYNLFNQNVLLPGRLSKFQELLSKILLVFFKDREVNHAGIFQLLVALQKATLKGLCISREDQLNLMKTIISMIAENENSIPKTISVSEKIVRDTSTSESFVELPNTETLLGFFETAVKKYEEVNQDVAGSFLTILYIIQLHLFKVNGIIFKEVLEYLIKVTTADLSQRPNKFTDKKTKYQSLNLTIKTLWQTTMLSR